MRFTAVGEHVSSRSLTAVRLPSRDSPVHIRFGPRSGSGSGPAFQCSTHVPTNIKSVGPFGNRTTLYPLRVVRVRCTVFPVLLLLLFCSSTFHAFDSGTYFKTSCDRHHRTDWIIYRRIDQMWCAQTVAIRCTPQQSAKAVHVALRWRWFVDWPVGTRPGISTMGK